MYEKVMCKDHPRVCGEQHSFFNGHGTVEGSPPRMRGTVLGEPYSWPEFRITPAYAGNSYVFPFKEVMPRDHPRVCGEQGNFMT